MATVAALLAAALILLATAALRGPEHDESYTIFLALGTPRPDWPPGVFTVTQAWTSLAGASTPASIAADLRATDVHPPLYFWTVAAWRALAGTSLFATRLLSVLCGIASLALVGAIARRLRVPPVPAILLTLGCYGFTYTAAIARGFALAQALNLAAILLLLHPPKPTGRILLAGLLLGAACLANYLAAFTAAAALAWAATTHRRLAWPAIAGFATALPIALWFFLAQRASRTGQFAPFELLPAIARLAKYAAANIFGGLPLYAGPYGNLVAAILALILAILLVVTAKNWRDRPGAVLLPLCAMATPLGLLTLGLVFNNTPIELRYLAFATPFAALLLAGALKPRLLAAILAIQSIAIAGLITRSETMQPQAAATQAATALASSNGLVLLPRGNDGTGLVGSVLLAAPPGLRLHLVTPTTLPASLRATAQPWPRVVLALLELDDASRATTPIMRAAFANDPCWREIPAPANLRAYDNQCRE